MARSCIHIDLPEGRWKTEVSRERAGVSLRLLGAILDDDRVTETDVVINDTDLTAIEDVFALAGGTRRRIRGNFLWVFLYNAIAVSLAALGLINPLFAAAAMAASSVIVVTNSRRPVFG